ncbi:MAG: hypothetical protein LBH62_05125 [Nitrososphaerota archaeon]|jgi:hypothetical protein|nr:hypothetical protein [Nitrososphaerota archaeon]
MSTDGIKYVPNAFYDLMVFIVPTMLLAVGVWIGLAGFSLDWVSSLNTSTLIILFVVCIVASYEYGRMAEALSAYLVQGPLMFMINNKVLTKLFNKKYKGDFLKGRKEIYQVLKLDEPYDKREGDKWAIYLYAFAKNSSIGADLLKRYAWEKLSRNSAFTYASLLIISIGFTMHNLIVTHSFNYQTFHFGSLWFTLACLVMVILTYVEYYRRNVWNYDLLTKAIPILMADIKSTTATKSDA